MKRRALELARRRAALVARSTAQRELLASTTHTIIGRLDRIDRRINVVRNLFRRPWLLLGAAAALGLLLGPRKLLRIGTRGAMWLGTAQRVMKLVHR
jgi:hypothetical protein